MKTLVRRILLGCICLIGVNGFTPLSASHLWVSPSGNDETGDGTELSPYQTITFALSQGTVDTLFLLADGNVFSDNILINMASRGQLTLLGVNSSQGDTAHVQAAQDGAIFNVAYIEGGNREELNPPPLIEFKNILFSHPGGLTGPAISADLSNGGNIGVNNCTFVNNDNSGADGGAIYYRGANELSVIQNSVFKNNKADNGAAIFAENGTIELSNNHFENNVAVAYGGAVALINSFDVTLERSRFYNNNAVTGGALYISSQSVLVDINHSYSNNVFAYNRSSASGAAVYYSGNALSSFTQFRENVFAENEAVGDGGALYAIQTSPLILSDNIIIDNSADGDGGAFAFVNMGTSAINIWSSQISGNTAGADGGAIFIDGANSFSLGGGAGTQNNLFHNRENSGLNNIASSNPISSLSLGNNYWGSTDQGSIGNQLDISNINNSWTNFADKPVAISQKLYAAQRTLWFADGSLQAKDEAGFFQPRGDSLFTFYVNIDSNFVIPGKDHLKKIYSLDMNGVSFDPGGSNLTVFIDETELDVLGSPVSDNITILQQTAEWQNVKTEAVGNGINTFSAEVDSFSNALYSVGLIFGELDTLLTVSPDPNRFDYGSNNPLKVEFRQEMLGQSINNQSVFLRGRLSGLLQANLFYDENNANLYIEPQGEIIAGEELEITLSDSIKTVDLNSLINGYSWSLVRGAFRGSGTMITAASSGALTGERRYTMANVDNDPQAELLELQSDRVQLFNFQDGAFVLQHTLSLSSAANTVHVADINNDGAIDVVLFSDANMVVFSYDPASGFSTTPVFSRSLGGGATLLDAKLSDFNNDGVIDVALLREFGTFRQFDMAYGDLQGSYNLGTFVPDALNGNADAMVHLDWDADGLFDLVTTKGDGNSTLGLIHNRRDSYNKTLPMVSGLTTQKQLAAADILQNDFKSRKEIIIAGNNGSNDILNYYNVDEEGELLLTPSGISFGAAVLSLEVADLNSDGKGDIVVGLDNNAIEIFMSQAIDGTFQRIPLTSSVLPQELLLSDFDGDQDLDLFAYSHSQSGSSWQYFENSSRAARVLYVRQGHPNGDGTVGNPFGSINVALQRSFTGDAIFVEKGLYEENLRISHDITISGEDTVGVVIAPGVDAPFFDALLHIKDAQVGLNNLFLLGQAANSQETGIYVENSDTLYTFGVEARNFEIAIEATGSNLILEHSRLMANQTGLRLQNSSAEFNDFSADSNTVFGVDAYGSSVVFNNSHLRDNGTNAPGENAAIALRQQSDALLYYSSLDSNYFSNLLLDDSYVNTQFAYIANAFSKTAAFSGAGILARNNARMDIENSVLADNGRFGAYVDAGDVSFLNSILAFNDSLAQNSGGGVFFRNGTVADVRNSVFLGNGTAADASGGTVTFEYNDVFANATAVQGFTPGTGNLAEDPLFIFQYNPLRPAKEVQGFTDLKLAPGSPLIDRGDPEITNGSSSSRSDIGLFGNLGSPQVLGSIPQLRASIEDSTVSLDWQAAVEDSIAAGITLFRSTTADFAPDTSDILAFLENDILDFVDEQVQFGVDYYYRAAFVDTSGGAYAYSPAILGRLDFLAFALGRDSLQVQLGQGDTLVRPLTIRNLGTLPLTVSFNKPEQASWLELTPSQREIDVDGSTAFVARFNSSGLVRDTTYTAEIQFSAVDDATISQTLNVEMFVSYRDLFAPRTLFASLNDTLQQAAASMRFSGFDSSFSSIGTPTSMLRYAWRFGKLDASNTVTWEQQDTTTEKALDFLELDDGRYRFQVAALDTAGNGGFADNGQGKDFTVKASVINIKRRLWQMKTIPRKVSNEDFAFTTGVESSLRFWKNGMYEYATVDSLRPGYSFWVISKDAKRVDMSGLKFIPSDEAFEVILEPGWNMLGNPWSWAIRWSKVRFETNAGVLTTEEALNQGVINSGRFRFSLVGGDGGGPYDMVKNDLLLHHTGYWVFLNGQDNVKMTYDSQPYLATEDLLEKTAPGDFGPQNDALISMVLRGESGQDSQNIFGVTSDIESYPHYMRGAFEPPSVENESRLFASENGRIFSTLLKEDAGNDEDYSWDLIVEKSASDKSVVLSWQSLKPSSNRYFFLYHLESGSWFNMADQEEYVVSEGEATQHFKLFATSDASFEPDVLPTRFALHQNFPNPFNPQTTIRLDIPFYADGENVKLLIYDVLGREINTLFNGGASSGTLELQWDGRDNAGQQVSSGVYFYNVRGKGFNASRKMVLIR